MKNLNNILGGFVVFIAMITLCFNVYIGVIDSYGLSDSYTGKNGDKTIFEALQDLYLLKSINKFNDALQNIISPSDVLDLLGALLNAGIGVVKIMAGATIFPVQIFKVIALYYSIPPIIVSSIILLFSLSIGFILLQYYTGK